jgi:hypothetical protein
MDKIKTQTILDKFQDVKLKDAKLPVLLSGYKSFRKGVRYRFRSDIIGIINARAYHIRTINVMSNAIKKAIRNPHLLKK